MLWLLSLQRAFSVMRTGHLWVGSVTSCQPRGWTGARARATASPEEDLWLWSKARRFRYVWPSFLAWGLVQLCSVFQNFLSEQGGLMYWIGLRQSNGTWTWVDNTVLQERWRTKSFNSAENIPHFHDERSPSLLWGSTTLPIQVWLSCTPGIREFSPDLYQDLSVAGTGAGRSRMETVCISRLEITLRRTGSEKTVASTAISSARCRFSSAFLYCYAEILPAGISDIRIGLGLSLIILHLSLYT